MSRPAAPLVLAVLILLGNVADGCVRTSSEASQPHHLVGTVVGSLSTDADGSFTNGLCGTLTLTLSQRDGLLVARSSYGLDNWWWLQRPESEVAKNLLDDLVSSERLSSFVSAPEVTESSGRGRSF